MRITSCQAFSVGLPAGVHQIVLDLRGRAAASGWARRRVKSWTGPGGFGPAHDLCPFDEYFIDVPHHDELLKRDVILIGPRQTLPNGPDRA